MKKRFGLLLVLSLSVIFFSSCTQPGVKKFQGMLDPKVGNAKRGEIDKILGDPAWCTTEAESQKCEYRTSRANNHPVPDMYRKVDAMGPDLSPYDQFDVLHLYFDAFGVLKEWEPVVVRP